MRVEHRWRSCASGHAHTRACGSWCPSPPRIYTHTHARAHTHTRTHTSAHTHTAHTLTYTGAFSLEPHMGTIAKYVCAPLCVPMYLYLCVLCMPMYVCLWAVARDVFRASRVSSPASVPSSTCSVFVEYILLRPEPRSPNFTEGFKFHQTLISLTLTQYPRVCTIPNP